jgi:hypothetical protein
VPGFTLNGEVFPLLLGELLPDFLGLLAFLVEDWMLGERDLGLIDPFDLGENIDCPPRPSVTLESLETIESRTFFIVKTLDFVLYGVFIF